MSLSLQEMEGRIQGLRDEQGAQQQQLSLQQQQLSLLQQEKACLSKEAEAAQHRNHKQQHQLQETQRALQSAETLVGALQQEKETLNHKVSQLQMENAKVNPKP